MATVWWSSGIAYLLSASLPPKSTLVATVFVCLVVGAFISGLGPTVAAVRGTWTEWLLALSYSRFDPSLAQWFECLAFGAQHRHVRLYNPE